MSPAIALPALEDFRPPYHLGASGSALVGVWSGVSPPPAKDLGGYEPVRWRGRLLGTAFLLRYDRPPPDYPVVYSEIVLAYVVRRFACLAAVPFDLVLDNQFFVDAGQHHYHLPKRLDPTLRIEVERGGSGTPRRMTASGNGIAFEAELRSTSLPGVPSLTSALVRGFTNLTTVVGSASLPLLGTTILMQPDAAKAYSPRGARLTLPGRSFQPLGGLFWESVDITIGVPRPFPA